MPDDANQMPRVSFRLPADERDRLDAEAEQRGYPNRSELLRALVREEL